MKERLASVASRIDGVANAVTTRRGMAMSVAAAAGAAVALAVGWSPRLGEGLVGGRRAGSDVHFVTTHPDPSAADLVALGRRLRERFAGKPTVAVMVFDDADAARLVRRGSRTIGEQRFQAALGHQRAMYLKQAARREDAFTIYATYPRISSVIRY